MFEHEALIRWGIGIVAAAGGYLSAFKRMRKDVNGIGRSHREFKENATAAILANCAPEKRFETAKLLKGGHS